MQRFCLLGCVAAIDIDQRTGHEAIAAATHHCLKSQYTIWARSECGEVAEHLQVVRLQVVRGRREVPWCEADGSARVHGQRGTVARRVQSRRYMCTTEMHHANGAHERWVTLRSTPWGHHTTRRGVISVSPRCCIRQCAPRCDLRVISLLYQTVRACATSAGSPSRGTGCAV